MSSEHDTRSRRPTHQLSEADIANRMQEGLQVPPVSLRLTGAPDRGVRSQADAVVEATWGPRSHLYVAEYKAHSTPRVVDAAMAEAKHWAHLAGKSPMIVVPYLSEEQLSRLESEGISGVDLSGNGFILAPTFAVRRSGYPSLFRSSQPIKNIYRGSSSVFARCFLLKPFFTTLADLRAFAIARLLVPRATERHGNRLTKATASKVVQALADELIVRKERDGLSVLDRPRLQERLAENYQRSSRTRVLGQTALSSHEVWRRLSSRQATGLRAAATGVGSSSHYGVLAGQGVLSLYVSDIDAAVEALQIRATPVFPSIEIVEEKSDTVYFDTREDSEGIWASPIQVWLELATGGPREREAAEGLGKAIGDGRAEDIA